ncbi:calcineurin-binding protein cabin-1-like isoform X2 [Uranotaenia lowii]|uniref:calcineurin-binding protein cabin-1-like isoform X2 n=1 Tax=Uranotaenia lowii TaxID=190385 RepID=UPI002479164E|nr:calcineurin-binding protein cabin-1-like isoform X2 [Uranotaenia lowii]
MLQIRALNDPEDSNSDTEEEPNVTGEAEETILISEYMRALNLKNSNDTENSLSLFLELLETEVLNKVVSNNDDNKLFLVKYNCYRNVGFLYQEIGNNDLALQYLIDAVELDGTDVYTMFYLAKLALEHRQIEIAKIYFEKCIERNPNHWPSLDGMLQVFCLTGNIIEAFLWAIMCHGKDHKYRRAANVLMEIKERFASSLPFLEELSGTKVPTFENHVLPEQTCFPADTFKTVPEEIPPFDYEQFKFDQLSWLAVGELIIQLHNYEKAQNRVTLYAHRLQCFYDPSNKTPNTPERMESSGGDEPVIDLNESINVEENDIKGRRRGSELKILEQWGWHKNRRSTRKKSLLDAADAVESTADGFIRRVFGQYLSCIEDDTSPFSGKKYNIDKSNPAQSHLQNLTLEDFETISRNSFCKLTSALQVADFDNFKLGYLYLSYLSMYWNEKLPVELRELFQQIYETTFTTYGPETWNQLEMSEITEECRVTLLYLELKLDNMITNDKVEISKKSHELLSGLQFYLPNVAESDLFLFQTRHLWLQHIVTLQENNINLALQHLEKLEALLENAPDITCIRLPNQKNNHMYDLQIVKEKSALLWRRIKLSSIKQLYENKKYEELIVILRESLSAEEKYEQIFDQKCANSIQQIKIMLECLWNTEQYTECLIWTEKALKFSIDMKHLFPNYRHFSWCDSINYCLIYIHSLLDLEAVEILKFDKLSRLIQSIHKVLTFMLDAPSDKNVSSVTNIDCWKAWAVLYYIIERRDKQKLELEPENLSNNLMIFFVAHELLGKKSWCSRNDSRFLYMILDEVIPKLRSPLYEPYRESIKEGLEQTIYCLYGYPTKKGRMRHIQEHDAVNQQLTWERAIQLFDVIRPDILPEFNSYKIDSISADMEALFQNMLILMPESCDISNYTNPIMRFINGEQSTLIPKAVNILNFKIRPIYYLLADYYFKSRDFGKAIHYYVMDLTIESTRFDSWAGVALSKASKCETTLNSTEIFSANEFLYEANNSMKCFEQCLMINENDPQLWVEYGSFVYNVHSFCARFLNCPNKSENDRAEHVLSVCDLVRVRVVCSQKLKSTKSYTYYEH